MPKLVAHRMEKGERKGNPLWEKALGPEASVVLGRTSESDWIADWEGYLSGRHARLTLREGFLSVEVLPNAKNPLCFGGAFYPKQSVFLVRPGERFSIGETVFELRGDPGTIVRDAPTPTFSKTVRAEEFERVHFLDADMRIDAISDFHAATRDCSDGAGFFLEVVKVLLKGISQADAVAVVKMSPRSAAVSEVEVVERGSRHDRIPDFQPSRKLIVEAVHEHKDPRVHTWENSISGLEGATPTAEDSFQEKTGHHFDWGFCVPLPQDRNARWGLYATGRFPSELLAKDAEDEHKNQVDRDLKFASIVAKALAAHRRVLDLQKRHDTFSRFLSNPVRQALADADVKEVLRPREVPVTILFCDLRGSCMIAEENHDDLLGLWARISEALGIMTSNIIAQNGVIGDFQGDAAMGFWGWPLDCPDQVERAARAAIEIRRRFENVSARIGHPLWGFRCGIGIAHGRAVAGALGTDEQCKVSVYGPTVNLASRLESLTKLFRVPILIEEAAAMKLEGTPYGRRKLAVIRPMGMSRPITVFELYQQGIDERMSDDDRGEFDVALNQFLRGEWKNAKRKLAKLPSDGAADLILRFIEDHSETPPPQWDGAISIQAK